MNAIQRLRQNYDMLGDLTDAEFIAAKAKACAKRLIHAERISDIRRIDLFGNEEHIDVSQIKKGDTIKVRATVRNMMGGTEKTGYVTLANIKDVQFENALNMLIIDAENCIFTTIDCQFEMRLVNAVIRGNNWVNEQVLSELISEDTLLEDFKQERDNGIEIDIEEDLNKNDLDFDSPEMPDLLF